MKVCSGIGCRLIFLIIIGSSLRNSGSEHIYNVEKYITKMYFEKHDRLIDSEFDSFVENEIPLDSSKVQGKCNIPLMYVVRRNIIGEGSHRHLSSSIKLKMQSDSHSELAMQFVLVFIERLPSGIFADSFELQHLVQRDVFSEAAVFGDTNLELPSFQSNRSIVEIHMNIDFKASSSNKEDLDVNLEIPVHARYQPLGIGFSRVKFGHPDLFVCYYVDSRAQKKSCVPMPTNYSFEYDTIHLVWDIPCGIREHATFVSAITFISAILAALIIVFASVYSAGSYKLKHL